MIDIITALYLLFHPPVQDKPVFYPAPQSVATYRWTA